MKVVMKVPSPEETEELARKYVDKRIKAISMMAPEPHPVLAGTLGTCWGIDGMGHLMMEWDDGSTLNLLPGVDRFEVVE